MKKILYLFALILSLFLITSCIVEESTTTVSIITPSGTPSLGVALAIEDDELFDLNLVSGSDALPAAFTNASYDIIVAPVNLGAKFYNSLNSFEYVYYKTIVGGCFYLVTSLDISSITELDNTEICVFGAGSTPDVVIKSLIKYYNLNVTINYVNDVTEANATLVSGKAQTIISAEPSISKFNSSNKFKTISLQEEWKKISDSSYNIPQAGVFVKKSKVSDAAVKKALEKIDASLESSKTNIDALVASAISVDKTLQNLGEEVLTRAVPKCNFVTDNYNPLEVEFYFKKLFDLGLEKTIGGALPGESFYM